MARVAEKPELGVFMIQDFDGQVDLEVGGTVGQLSSNAVLSLVGTHCFVCEKPLTSDNSDTTRITREDLFPKWLKKNFMGPGDKIEKSNGEFILLSKNIDSTEDLVPCCRNCNNVLMSQVENRISCGVKGGYARFMKISDSDIFLWSSKIIYGLIYIGVNTWDFSTKEASSGWLKSEALEHLKLTSLLMKGFRKRVVVSSEKRPFSILKFHLKNSRRTSPNYGYRDSISWPTTLALQMGSVGLIVGFEDFGFLEWWYDQNYGELLRGKCLHPAQFWEIAGRAVYAGGLGGWDVSYSIIENEKGMFITLDPRIREGHPEDPQRLADIVAAFTEIPDLAKIARPGTTPTLLIDKDGNYQDMPA